MGTVFWKNDRSSVRIARLTGGRNMAGSSRGTCWRTSLVDSINGETLCFSVGLEVLGIALGVDISSLIGHVMLSVDLYKMPLAEDRLGIRGCKSLLNSLMFP